MGNYPSYSFKLNGIDVNPPKEWEGLQILATFERDSPQANITTNSIEFVNEAAKLIRDHIAAGLTGGPGIFEGIPFEINLTSNSGNYQAFRGYLDMTDGFSIQSPVSVLGQIKKDSGIVSFSERSSGISFGYLEQLGVFSSTDYQDEAYVIQREFEFLEFAMISLSTFMLLKELAEITKQLAKDIATIVGISGAGVTGPASGAIYAIAVTILNLAYGVLIVIYLINLINELISYIFSPIRYHKSINWFQALKKAINYLGYDFQSSISDLLAVNYLPSKTEEGNANQGGPGSGLPGSGDYGYLLSEMIELAKTTFEARITIKDVNGNPTVFLEPLKNSAFWNSQSSFIIPDILDEVEEFNSNELKANKLISFELDLNDYWTLSNYQGNSYEITTDSITTINQKYKGLKGLDEVRIPAALPTRKEGLTALESALKSLAQLADSVVNFFGGSSSLASQIQARVGMMKLSSHEVQIPKLIKKVNGTIPANHRQIWSAKYLWDNYINETSFVSNNYRNQWKIHREKKIPFGFFNFLQTIDSGFCTTFDGRDARIDEIKWDFSSDYALITYRTREPYTTNLIEFTREQI